jgi:acetyl esterase
VSLRPELAEALERANATPAPPLAEQGPEGARRTHAEVTAAVAGTPEPVAGVEEHAVAGPGGEVTVRVYRPQTRQTPGAIAYFHGGGWVAGTLDTYDALARAVANASGTLVANVGYRLAPEHPFPAGLEDSWAALRWLAAHVGELGADPGRLAVAGDSAGGAIATVLARRARDAGGPALRFQVLVYPAVDPTASSASYRELGEGYSLTGDDMRWYWHQYLGDADQADPDIAPGRADLAGLPPALVITAEYDPLRDEGEAYAHAMEAAGVPVRLHRWPGVVHGFFRWRAVTPAAHEAAAEAGMALRDALSPSDY